MATNLPSIRKAIDAFEIDQARQLLADALRETPSAEVFYLASLVALNGEQRQNFLLEAVSLDPDHQAAKTALSVLQDGPALVLKQSTPVAPPPVSTEPEKSFVLTTVATNEEFLYEIPTLHSAKVAHLHRGNQLMVIARDEKIEWMNVIYQSSTGQPVLGWIPGKNLQGLSCMGNDVKRFDLPISDFEWYTREQVKDVLGQRQAGINAINQEIKKLNTQIQEMNGLYFKTVNDALSGVGWGCIFTGATGVASFLIFLGPIFISDFTYPNTVGGWFWSLVCLALFIVFSIGLSVYAKQAHDWITHRKEKRHAIHTNSQRILTQIESYKQMLAAYNREVTRLKRIIEMKTPEQEKLMAMQFKSAAIQTAMNVGANIITRLVPDRQQVTHRQK